MGQAELHNTDYANLRGAYGYLGVTPLTTQQEMFILTHMRGMSIRASEAACGMTRGQGNAVLAREGIDKIREFFRQQIIDQTCIDLNMLNTLALEAHRKSSSATEELKAVEILGKLNMVGGFAPAQVLKDRSDAEKTGEKEIGPASAKHLEQMPEDKLLELAAFDRLESLDPTPVRRPAPAPDDDALEGEFTPLEDTV